MSAAPTGFSLYPPDSDEEITFCRDVAAGRCAVPPAESRSVCGLLAAHGLEGVALTALDEGLIDSPGPEFEQTLRNSFRATRRLTAILDLECHRIGKAVMRSGGGGGLPILLKGFHVARYYTDPSLRGYVDVDLLVPSEERANWITVLEALGYEQRFDGWLARDHAKFRHAICLARSIGNWRIAVDLHACLWMERRARMFGYAALLPYTVAVHDLGTTPRSETWDHRGRSDWLPSSSW